MNIQNIVVPIDFSAPSLMALKYAVELARPLRARLTLLHVLERQLPLNVLTEADLGKIEADHREDAFRRLGTLLAPEDEDDLDVRLVLKVGNPRVEIEAAAEQLHADLVVLGTHGRGRLGRLMLGSVTEGLLRKLHIPVMTTCHLTSPKGFKRILFATDLAESAEAAFTFALGLAKTLKAEIVALHALGGPPLTSGELGFVITTEEDAADEARRKLHALAREGARHGVHVGTLVADGLAANQILNAAKEYDADLILLGIEDKGILERALLGTTAEPVVRTAEVPVLSVPVHAAQLRT